MAFHPQAMGKRSDIFRSGSGDDAILHNKLTIREARHIIRTEGGELSAWGITVQVITVLAVAGFSARAIIVGKATAWHLLLPMLAEYLVLLIAMPPMNLILRDPELRKESRRGGVLLAILAAVAAGWVAYRAHAQEQAFAAAAGAEWAAFRDWVVSAGMHWAIFAAMAGRIGAIPGRIAAYRQHGPPFMPIGLGCAMRGGLFVLGVFFLPWVVAASGKVVWALWGLILIAEAAALWMHLDIQMRLKKKGIKI